MAVLTLDKIIFRNNDSYLKMYKGSELIAEVESTPALDYLTFTALEAGSTVYYQYGTGYATLEKSLDGGQTWSAFNTSTNKVTLTNVGDSVKVRNTKTGTKTPSSGFKMTGQIKASGSIMSLQNGNPNDTSAVTTKIFKCLFKDCAALKDITELKLPATTLTQTECYSQMFSGCTGITSIPSGFLPATTLSNSCYSNMFFNCSNLTTIPANLLPATTLTQYCYSYMFYNCRNLVSVPANLLPATTLATFCYNYMFAYNTNLVQVPNIVNITSGANRSYSNMFQNCGKIREIHIYLDNASKFDIGYFRDWLSNCGPSGVLYNHGNMDTTYIVKGPNGCPYGWYWSNELPTLDLDYLTFTAQEANSTVTFSRTGTVSKYSTDNGTTWNDGDNVTVTLANIGDSVKYKGVSVDSETAVNNAAFTLTGSVSASGSIMSMDNEDPNSMISKSNFSSYFKNQTSLTTCPVLPVRILKTNQYASMFSGCTGLTTLPSDLLPSKSSANSCYSSMFNYCTGLTSAAINISPEANSYLASDTFSNTFMNCTNLVTGPTFNNASVYINKPNVFKQTFYNCSNMTTTGGYLGISGDIGSSACSQTFYKCKKLNGGGFINIGSITSIGGSAFYGFMEEAKISSTSKIQRLYQPQNTIRVTNSSFYRAFYMSNFDNNVVSIDLHNYTFGGTDDNAFGFMFSQTDNYGTPCYITFNSEDNLPTPDPTDNPNNDVPNYMFYYMFEGSGLLFQNGSYAPNFSKYTGQAKSSCYYRMFSNARSNYGQSGANWDIVLPNQAYNSGDNSYSYMFTSTYYLVNSLTYQLLNGDTSKSPSSTHNSWLSDVSSNSRIFNCYEGGWDVIINYNGRNNNTVPSNWTLNVTTPPATDIIIGDITAHTKIGTGLDNWELWNDGTEPQNGKIWIRCSAANTSSGDISYVNLEINNINHGWDYPMIDAQTNTSDSDIKIIMTQSQSGTTMNLPTSNNYYASVGGGYVSETISQSVFYPGYASTDTYNVTFALYCGYSGNQGDFVALGIPTW